MTDQQQPPEYVARGVSPRNTCALLGIQRRRLRQLVSEGRLAMIGEGHKKQITMESLAAEIERRKEAMHLAAVELRQRIAAFDAPGLEVEPDPVHSEN